MSIDKETENKLRQYLYVTHSLIMSKTILDKYWIAKYIQLNEDIQIKLGFLEDKQEGKLKQLKLQL